MLPNTHHRFEGVPTEELNYLWSPSATLIKNQVLSQHVTNSTSPSSQCALTRCNNFITIPGLCYILDLPWTTLRPKPFPEDTHATFLITFHALLDKPQTWTLPGLPHTMAYARSPLFTFYYMTHSPYLHFPLSCYHWLSTRPSTLPIRYICQESNPQHSPWWSYQSNNCYWYLSSLQTSPWSKG